MPGGQSAGLRFPACAAVGSVKQCWTTCASWEAAWLNEDARQRRYQASKASSRPSTPLPGDVGREPGIRFRAWRWMAQ